MRIAIIGAGFAGLAAAWKLQSSGCAVTLFDCKAPAASRVAAGLLHPFVGAAAKYNWKGNEGMAATKVLLEVAAAHTNHPVSTASGLLRVAINDQQKEAFQRTAHHHPHLQWLSSSACQKRVSGVTDAPALFIPEALTVYCDHYLDGLLAACNAQGVISSDRRITNLQQLGDYNAIVVAAGADSAPLTDLHLKPIKGQILTFKWPAGVAPLPCPLSSHAYLVMSDDGNYCYGGSSYEHTFSNNIPDIASASALLMPKIATLFPPLACSTPIDCRAAIRVVTPQRRPLVHRQYDNCWVITGLGSKGLLYHALMANELASQML